MYILNYIHLFLYIIILVASYYATYVLIFPLNILTCVPFGWSLYAMVSVGHDCAHDNFSPYSKMNQILSYVCLNGIVMPRRVWILEHQFHHANPGHPEDNMILDSNSFLSDIKQLLLSKHDTKPVEELAKLPFIVAMLFLPLYCLPIIWITTLSSFAYLSLATHIVDPNIRELDHESPKAAEDIALNIFPKSHLFTFLAGGLNIHAAHHLNPRWTRWELMQESDNHPSKKIETVKDYWYLIKSR